MVEATESGETVGEDPGEEEIEGRQRPKLHAVHHMFSIWTRMAGIPKGEQRNVNERGRTQN